jgi:hypothetical protein
VTDPGAKQHDPQVQVARINRTGTIITAVIGGVVTVTAAVITGVVTHNNDVSGAASAAPTTVTVSVPAPAAAPGPASAGPSSTTDAPAPAGGHPVWNLPTTQGYFPLSTGPQTVAGHKYVETLYGAGLLCDTVPVSTHYQTDGKYSRFTAEVAVVSGGDGMTAVFSVQDSTGHTLGDPVTAQLGQPPQAMDVPIGPVEEITLVITGGADGCQTGTGAFIDPEVS